MLSTLGRGSMAVVEADALDVIDSKLELSSASKSEGSSVL